VISKISKILGKLVDFTLGKQKKILIYTRTWDPFCWEHSNFLTLWLAYDRLWSSNSDPEPKYHLLPMCTSTDNATGNSLLFRSSAGSQDHARREIGDGGQRGGVNRVCNVWGYGGHLARDHFSLEFVFMASFLSSFLRISKFVVYSLQRNSHSACIWPPPRLLSQARIWWVPAVNPMSCCALGPNLEFF
jgi:hypothetical protein